MKLFSEYQHANIGMLHDNAIIETLKDFVDAHDIDVIIETGTNLGLGSTTMLAEAFKGKNTEIHTIEVNYPIYKQAKHNLVKYPNVHCHYGCSSGITEAITFIEQDEAILNHENYPDYFIDSITDPVGFYTKEIKGILELNRGKVSKLKDLFKPNLQEDLLRNLINKYKDKKLLVVLDSAGGTGKLEFDITKELLKDQHYFILLDDTHHLKHFRSVQEITSSPEWTVIGSSDQHGWMLAEHKA